MNDDDSDMTLLANDPSERAAFEAAIARLDRGIALECDPDTLEPISPQMVRLDRWIQDHGRGPVVYRPAGLVN